MRQPTIDIGVVKDRRARLGKLIPGCAVVLPAWPEYIRNHDMHHAYRVESNLFYLSGFEEPESCLIFRPGMKPETILFVRTKSENDETWDGYRYGPKMAKEIFAADETYTYDEFVERAADLLKDCEKIYYSLFRNHEFDELFGQAMLLTRGRRPRGGRGIAAIEDVYPLLGELRLFKSEAEVKILRHVCQATAEAHIEVMKATKPGINERALQGVFINGIMQRGCSGEAYGSIVASGQNAVYLHYRFNERQIADGDFVLIDAGGEYCNYSADITRTYPANGSFSPAQRRLYQKVLDVQKQLINMCRPGVVHADLQKQTISSLVDIMIDEKLLRGSKEDIIQTMSYLKYYPHGVSHMLGLDTHDAGVLAPGGRPRAMEAGWVFTIEPGIYIPPNDTQAPADLRGLGIRIEDDILITQDGVEVLTAAVPKEIAAMEAIIGSGTNT